MLLRVSCWAHGGKHQTLYAAGEYARQPMLAPLFHQPHAALHVCGAADLVLSLHILGEYTFGHREDRLLGVARQALQGLIARAIRRDRGTGEHKSHLTSPHSHDLPDAPG